MVGKGSLFGLVIEGLARNYCLTHSVIISNIYIVTYSYIDDHDIYTLTKHVKGASPNSSETWGKCMFYWSILTKKILVCVILRFRYLARSLVLVLVI